MRINLSIRARVVIGLFILLLLYVLFQARFLILGPKVTVLWPRDGEVATTSLMTISGNTSNIAWISLNGRQIFTDEKGQWSEKLLLSPGTSIMTVVVRDRFGREYTERVRVIYNP